MARLKKDEMITTEVLKLEFCLTYIWLWAEVQKVIGKEGLEKTQETLHE